MKKWNINPQKYEIFLTPSCFLIIWSKISEILPLEAILQLLELQFCLNEKSAYKSRLGIRVKFQIPEVTLITRLHCIIKISLIKWYILYKIGVKYFLIDPLFWVLPLVILLKITSFLPFSFKPGPESKIFTSVTPIILKFYIYSRNAISLDQPVWPTGLKSQYFENFFIFPLK